LAEDTVWQMHERTNAQLQMKGQLAARCPKMLKCNY